MKIMVKWVPLLIRPNMAICVTVVLQEIWPFIKIKAIVGRKRVIVQATRKHVGFLHS